MDAKLAIADVAVFIKPRLGPQLGTNNGPPAVMPTTQYITAVQLSTAFIVAPVKINSNFLFLPEMTVLFVFCVFFSFT